MFVNFIFAFLGGLLMNFMPCVLPFISIKISSFIKSSDCRRKFTLHNLSYSAGILTFFVTLSVVLLVLQRSSQMIIIGSHMQSSNFLLAVFFVLLLVGLNLSGFFEFTLPIGLNRVSNLVSKNNWFFKSLLSGFFVSLFAVSCTAPFIVTALTYGLTNPKYMFVVMIGMAIGFSFPFLIATLYFKRISNILPRSGEWMVKLQKLLALPIFACLLWILFVLIKQDNYFGVGVALSFGFAIVSFFSVRKLFHNFFEKKIIYSVFLGVVIFSFSYFCLPALKLQQYEFSYKNFNEAIENKKKVLVVASASWCITCHLNEFNVFNKPDFKNQLAKSEVVYMYLDLTNSNDEGSKFLSHYKHSGVPFYIIFNTDGTHEILPQILTKQLVINKINNLT